MTKKIKTVTLVIATFVFLLCVATSVVFMAQKSVHAEEINYVNPLPTGSYVEDYTVLDLAKDYGDTDNKITISTTTAAVTNSYAMNSNKAVRFRIKVEGASSYGPRFALFMKEGSYEKNTEAAHVYFQLPSTKTNFSLNVTYQGEETVTPDDTFPFDAPTWLATAYSSGTSIYNVEVGAPAVLNSNGDQVGVLFYLEYDGVRILEKFIETDAKFGGSFFSLNTNKTTTISQSSETAKDLTGKVTVSATDCMYTGETVTPKLSVSAVLSKTVGGTTYPYGQVIEPMYYDVVYTDNDKVGVATATLTFKDKYSGTASTTFEIKDPLESYVTPIDNGYYVGEVKVFDLAETYGEESNGDKVIPVNVIEETQFTAKQDGSYYEMGDCNAYRLKLTPSSSTLGWGQRFALFCDQEYTKCVGKASIYFQLRKNVREDPAKIFLYVQANNKTITAATKEYSFPEWFGFPNITSAFNVEVGAPEVFDQNGQYVGVLAYLEINGARLVEEFISADTVGAYRFSGGNASISCVPTGKTEATRVTYSITPYDNLQQDLIYVQTELVKDSLIVNEKSKYMVKGIVEVEGVAYPKLIEDNQFDVELTENAGTATATLCFKDKYVGETTLSYTNSKIDFSVDGNIYSMHASAGEIKLPDAPVSAGKVLVGYEEGSNLLYVGETVVANSKTYTAFVIEFETECKASIKAVGTKGMRILTTIKQADKQKLLNYGFEFGSRFTSPDMAGYLDVPTTNWYSISAVADGMDEFTAVLTGIGEDKYNTRFQARAYIEKDGKRIYSYLDDETYTRSYAQVATLILADSEELSKYSQQEIEFFEKLAEKYQAN